MFKIQYLQHKNYTNYKNMRVEALILSQFNDKKGFAIIKVIPKEGVITEKQFSVYSQLILHRQQLCGKLLVLQFMQKYYLVGVPLLSVNMNQNGAYTRARYIYSVNILVAKSSYLDQSLQAMYKQIAKKLGHFFKFIEETSHIIYNHAKYQQYLSKILQKCFKGINNKTQCVLNHLASCYTILSFNRPPNFAIKEEQTHKKKMQALTQTSVPVTFLTSEQIQGEVQSQIGKQLLHFARMGDYTIKKIIKKVENEKAVYKYYYKAISMGLVYITDMFCIYNQYYLTQKIHEYLPKDHENNSLLQIYKAVTIPNQHKLKNNKKQSNNATEATPNDLLRLYFQFHRKVTIKKILNDNLDLISKIDFIRFLRISYILGIIKRIYERLAFINEKQEGPFEFVDRETYIIIVNRVPDDIKQEKQRFNISLTNHIKRMSSIQQICVSLDINRIKLFKILRNPSYKDKIRIFFTLQ